MREIILEVAIAVATGVAALAVGGVCVVGLVVWLAGGRERRQP
jgi:hypothetical protein